MKKSVKFKTLSLTLILGLLITSCISNVEEQLEEVTENPTENTITSFKTVVKPIIDGRCLSCHSAGGNFPELTSYAKINANATIVKDAVSSGRMPQGGTLTSAQIKSIIDWVDEGALDN
tara:strand:+ start:11563 stop:11919 length:357 start_codon:yes stop_codon:yes gene_type:complete